MVNMRCTEKKVLQNVREGFKQTDKSFPETLHITKDVFILLD